MADKPIPAVARVAPMNEVSLRPILSLRIPTKKDKKNVVPIVRDPIKAEKHLHCNFHWDDLCLCFILLPHLVAASSTPASSISFFSWTKRIPKVLMIPKMIPLTRKQLRRTNQAQKPPSGGWFLLSTEVLDSLSLFLSLTLALLELSVSINGVRALDSVSIISAAQLNQTFINWSTCPDLKQAIIWGTPRVFIHPSPSCVMHIWWKTGSLVLRLGEGGSKS